MPVIEFLAQYAALFISRASKEYPGLNINVAFVEVDGRGTAILNVADRDGGIELAVEHPLLGVLSDAYTPVLEEDQWELFINNVTQRVLH